MPKVSELTQKLISKYEQWHMSQEPKKNVATIHVDEVASKVAAFYEKVRGIIDWKEEHLLKRRAIERMFKRRVLMEEKDIAEPLILELIRGGHFPNDQIEETKIGQIQKIIDKHIYILKNAPEQEKISFYTWLSEIAACEIEEALSPSLRERSLINYMFGIMRQRITLNEKVLKVKRLTDKEKDIQIYIAVQRALFNLDAPVISYHLLKYYYPNWKNPNEEELKAVAKDILLKKREIENNLNHPLADKFYQITEKYDTPYLLLGDVLSEDLSMKQKVSDPKEIEKSITKAYEGRVKTLKRRLGRAAFYATLSIFLTNIVSLLAVEIPFTKYFTGSFNWSAIIVDILGPTLLMFLLVITIKPPKKENLSRVLMEVMKVVYDKGKDDVYEIKMFRKKNVVFSTIMNLFYLAGFLVILAIIVWGLSKVNFPPLSYFIFVIFLSLIAFAGAKIRSRAKELQVIEEKETLWHFFIDPFAVPVIQLGKWLTIKWKRYNIVAVFFSALIDMPFTTFVEFIEQWRYFLKEKKEKIH